MSSREWARTRPKSFTLPFGYKVRIAWLGTKRFDRDCGKGMAGMWRDFDERKTGIIYINTGYHLAQQLDTLQHEMHHAVTDWGGRVAWMAEDYRRLLGEAQLERVIRESDA